MRDYAGPNTLLKAFQLIRQAIKNASPAAGDGLSKEGDTLSVTTPVRGIITQAEFDALTEAQKNSGLYVISDGSGEPGGGSSAGEVYSTEETRIGTWIDGKPLYRRTYILSVSCPGASETTILDNDLPAIDVLTKIYGVVVFTTAITSYPSNKVAAYFRNDGKIMISNLNSAGIASTIKTCTIEYTKTTDEGGTA